ncbi:hypothetical protein [Methanospirillum hungatei]|uniref:tetratricopeptide repeat protein n=1 Tax=Methanospirillum hungatei TaxID=2203 RepID=UPI0026EF4075|nr:hypothetical protein [Methanospirillum hungatei]MCA1916328.1 hypothetical protein [Methanospirillum hungatei]
MVKQPRKAIESRKERDSDNGDESDLQNENWEISKFISAGRYDEALSRCNQLLKASDSESDIWAYKGLILKRQGLPVAASVCFENARYCDLEEEILLPEVGYSKDILKESLGICWMETTSLSDPKLHLHFDLIIAVNSLYFNNNRNRVLKYLNFLMKKYPQDPALYAALAFAEGKINDLEKARHLFNCAVSYATLPIQYRILGILFDLAGMKEEAYAHYLIASEDLIFRQNLARDRHHKKRVQHFSPFIYSHIKGKHFGSISRSDANLFLLSSLIVPNSKVDDITQILKTICGDDNYENIFSTIATYTPDKWNQIPRLTSYEGPHMRIHKVAEIVHAQYGGDFRNVCEGVSRGEIAQRLAAMGAADCSISTVLTGLYIGNYPEQITTWNPDKKLARTAARIIFGTDTLPKPGTPQFSRIQSLAAPVDDVFYFLSPNCVSRNPYCHMCSASAYCIYRIKKAILCDYS